MFAFVSGIRIKNDIGVQGMLAEKGKWERGTNREGQLGNCDPDEKSIEYSYVKILQ
jgi:hypothetical protein